jgi:uncharacterized membrane protein
MVLAFLIITFSAGTAAAHKKHQEAPAPVQAPAIVAPVEAPAIVDRPLQAPQEPAPEIRTRPGFLSWIGRFHPLVIHFPIALLLAALIAELLFSATGELLFRHALRFCLWGGALGVLAAAPLGWAFAASGATESGWLLEAHRWTGSSASILCIAAVWANERVERVGGSRLPLQILLVILALLTGSAGFLGGSLLYGLDHLAWRT